MMRNAGWLLAIVAVWLLCAVAAPRPAAALDEETLEDIISLGILLSDDFAEDIVSTFGSAAVEEKGVSTDPQLNARADRIFRKVAAGAERRNYELKVLNDSTVNAYAVLGGHLYVNRGLLTLPGASDDEVAAVVGHEIAHIEKRHGLKQLKQQILISAAVTRLTKDDEKRIVAALLGQLYLSGRSQKDEREADLEGARLAMQAGYNPAGGVTFMRRLEKLSGDERARHGSGSSLLAQLGQRLSTHPPTQERSEYLKDYLFTVKYGSSFQPGAPTPAPSPYPVGSGAPRDKILLTTGPHHIGDDRAGVSTIWSGTFDLTEADLAGRNRAKVVFQLRSVEVRRDPNVYFNRVLVGSAITQSHTWERFEFDVPLTALRIGRNLVDIESVIVTVWQSYDDCEFKHVYLVLEGSDVKKADRGLGTPIVIHFHTVFSDGDHTPQQVKDGLKEDVYGVVITDHHGGISRVESKTQEVALTGGEVKTVRDKPGGSYGYRRYWETVSQLTDDDFVSICGVEVSCSMLAEGDLAKESHLLLLDISEAELRRQFMSRDGTGMLIVPQDEIEVAKRLSREVAKTLPVGEFSTENVVALEKVLSTADSLHVPTVAAHPENPIYPYPLGRRGCRPRLVEFFNTGVIDQSAKMVVERERVEAAELKAYLRVLQEEPEAKIGVTAGSDFHTRWQNGLGGDTDQWHRYTYVCGLQLRPSKQDLLGALYKGQTYAAVEKAAFVELSPLPGMDTKRVPRIRLQARVQGNHTLPTTLYLYRADRTAPLQAWRWPASKTPTTFSYEDPEVTPGRVYTYVFYAPGQLITSPIRLELSPSG